MSTPAGIVSALQTLLENDATLSAYVEQVLLGSREAGSITLFPTLIIEPLSDEETDLLYTQENNHLIVQAIGLIKVLDKEKQIVGDANTKGILDIANDVKKAIDADRTLSATAIKATIKTTSYRVDFPLRYFTMNIDIMYRQTVGVRT